MGRRTRTTYPDGTSLTNEYFSTGELKETVGSRSYPVEYEYTDQGRMKKMHTWMNYAGNGGKATTTWQYDAKRGWMTNKVYESQSTSVAYVTCQIAFAIPNPHSDALVSLQAQATSVPWTNRE